MKKMIPFLSSLFLAVFTLLILSTTLWAQPWLPEAPSQAPIDGGLSILALSGGAYALKKIRDNKKG